jgi:hypothetical protein
MIMQYRRMLRARIDNWPRGPAINMSTWQRSVNVLRAHGLISPSTSTTQIDEYVSDTLCLSRPTREICYTLLSVSKQNKARHFVTLIFGILILRKYKPWKCSLVTSVRTEPQFVRLRIRISSSVHAYPTEGSKTKKSKRL